MRVVPLDEWVTTIQEHLDAGGAPKPRHYGEGKAITNLDKCENCGVLILFVELYGGKIAPFEVYHLAIDDDYQPGDRYYLWKKSRRHDCAGIAKPHLHSSTLLSQ